jgi:hypothetical protein
MTRTVTARILAVASACVVLAACGGSSRTSPAPRVLARHAATVTFTMHWPGTASAARARRPRFISPSAQSVVVEVNSGASPAGPVTFANNPSTNGAPATSTIAIDAPAGTDDFSIALFDQPQTVGETAPAGTQLGRAAVTQTIVAGKVNTLDAIVAGIVGGVRVAPAANQPFVTTLSAVPPQGFALIGDQPEIFVLTAVDPDGNVIVPVDTSPAHADTPVVSLAPSPATAGLTVTAVASDPSRFVVRAANPKSSPNASSALIASATDGAGDHAQSVVSIEERSAVYVSYGAGGIAVYDDLGNRIALPASAFAGLSDAGAIAYDADDRRVYVADAGTLRAFDASGNPVAGFAAPAVSGANGIAYDANAKALYVCAPGVVNVFAPNGGPPASGPSSFAAPHAAGIAYVPGSTPQLAVANADPAAPSFDLYGEDGTPLASRPTGGSAAPVAIAYANPAQTIYLAAGTTIASFALSGAPAATVTDANVVLALAFDQNLAELYAAEGSGGAVVAFGGDLTGADPAHGIPASSGPNPKGVAVAF